MVITRSQARAMATANTTAVDTDGQDRRSTQNSRPTSPSPSHRSNSSTTSTVKRQRLQQLQLEAAEKLAEIDRRLLAEKLAIQTQAIEDEEEELTRHNVSRAQSRTSLLHHDNPDIPALGPPDKYQGTATIFRRARRMAALL
ncbi:hypothetical protein ACJJTC_013213 [Scirpophaga incertulas]